MMEETKQKSRPKKSVKSTDSQAIAQITSKTVIAKSELQKQLLSRAWDYYLNKFTPSPSIERFCSANGIDYTYVGLSSGDFHTTISRQHSAFSELQSLGILNIEGQDAFFNHVVVPVMDGMDIIGLKFEDLVHGQKEAALSSAKPEISYLNDSAFQVEIKNRKYLIENLKKSDYQLKALLTFSSGDHQYVDVVNFYSAGNRKKLAEGICENLFFPYSEVRDDINSLLSICKNYQSKSLSENSAFILEVIQDKKLVAFTTQDIKKHTDFAPMTIHRALDELVSEKVINKDTKKKPFTFTLIPTYNKTML